MHDNKIEWIWDMLNKKEMKFHMWLYVYVHVYKRLFTKSLDSTITLSDTVIQMIWDERPLGPVWTHTEALGCVFGRFCLLGAYACSMMITEIQMLRYMRYEMRFPHLSIVAPGHDGFVIARPSRSRYDEIIPLGSCLVIVFGIQYLIL